MRIGGFRKCSLIDHPGKISAVVFTAGCNLECTYCHNPELLKPELFPEAIPEEEIISFLSKRRGLLDAVTITGGEPTQQKDLHEFMKKIKGLGFLTKLDTNGINPEVIRRILREGAVDYIAMDIKAPFKKYREITGSEVDPEKVKMSIKLIVDSGKDYEFRTTIAANQLDKDDMIEIARLIKEARLYVLQKFTPSTEKNLPKLEGHTDEKLMEFQKAVSPYVNTCIIR